VLDCRWMSCGFQALSNWGGLRVLYKKQGKEADPAKETSGSTSYCTREGTREKAAQQDTPRHCLRQLSSQWLIYILAALTPRKLSIRKHAR
jgi:hypothetical protein